MAKTKLYYSIINKDDECRSSLFTSIARAHEYYDDDEEQDAEFTVTTLKVVSTDTYETSRVFVKKGKKK